MGEDCAEERRDLPVVLVDDEEKSCLGGLSAEQSWYSIRDYFK